MASTAYGEPGTNELVALLSWGSAIAAVSLVGLLAIALVAELLRRRRRAARLVATLDRAVPIAVRTAVVTIVTLVTALIGAHPAGGTDDVRAWLDGSTTSTSVAPATSTTTRPPTSTTTTTTLAGPSVLAPPLVLDPPVTPQDLEPPSAAPSAPAPTPTPAAPAPSPAPSPTPAGASTKYVVVVGDCLWSISAHRLGSGADARSIDADWRAIYASNRAAIGDDPNLIHPGLTLMLPPLPIQP
jgi:nucleoid-associated protein YgaU